MDVQSARQRICTGGGNMTAVYTPARRTDPRTSREAGAAVNIAAMEAAVYGALKSHGPMTSFEIAELLRLSLVSVSPRLRPLADKGLIRDSGVRRTGESRRARTVWEIV